MNKRLDLARQALRLLPSKTNPRVKRWQAPHDGGGKAAPTSDKDWFSSYDQYLEIMTDLNPHLDPHLRRLERIQRSAPHRGFHYKDYLTRPAPRSGIASRNKQLFQALPDSYQVLGELGIESPDAFVSEYLGTAFPVIVSRPPRPKIDDDIEHGDLNLYGGSGYYSVELSIPKKMHMLRSYNPGDADHPRTANHVSLELFNGTDNLGLGTAIYAANEAFARNLGSKNISLYPAGVGRYAWPYFGFDIRSADSHFSQDDRLRKISKIHEMLLYDIMGNIKLNRRDHGKPIPMIEDIEEAIATSPDPYKAPTTGLEVDFLPRLAHMRLPDDFAKSLHIDPRAGRPFLLDFKPGLGLIDLEKDLTRDNPYYDKAVASRLKRAMGGT